MKPSVSFLAILLAGLTLTAGPALADAMAVPSVTAILTTETPPDLLRYVIDKEEIPKNFEQQPPLIPHTSETKTISLRENKCLHCHMKQPGEKQAQSKEMSKSHFIDRSGKKLDRPASNRYFCTQCHVPQVDAKPLVESNFQSLAAK
jgi:cytochrome c-type protein NapB